MLNRLQNNQSTIILIKFKIHHLKDCVVVARQPEQLRLPPTVVHQHQLPASPKLTNVTNVFGVKVVANEQTRVLHGNTPGRKERLGSKDAKLATPVEQTHEMVIITVYIMVRCRL